MNEDERGRFVLFRFGDEVEAETVAGEGNRVQDACVAVERARVVAVDGP